MQCLLVEIETGIKTTKMCKTYFWLHRREKVILCFVEHKHAGRARVFFFV